MRLIVDVVCFRMCFRMCLQDVFPHTLALIMICVSEVIACCIVVTHTAYAWQWSGKKRYQMVRTGGVRHADMQLAADTGTFLIGEISHTIQCF